MSKQTLADIFNSARLLAGSRKSLTHHFTELVVAGIEYHGTLLTRKGDEHRQGRDKWTATIYMIRQEPGEAVGFQGHGATEKEAIDDMQDFATRWADEQPTAAPGGQGEGVG